jgi:hypothetical protein
VTYRQLIAFVVAMYIATFGYSLYSKPTPSKTPISAETLIDILTIIIAPNSPLENLGNNLSSELQVSLPKVKGSLPKKIGDVMLVPINDDKTGLRLEINIITSSREEVKLRASTNFYDPERGPWNMGAQWKDLIFRKQNGTWSLYQDLGGAIK